MGEISFSEENLRCVYQMLWEKEDVNGFLVFQVYEKTLQEPRHVVAATGSERAIETTGQD